MKNLLFAVPENSRNTDIGLFVFRVWAGFALLYLHGLGKLPPRPGFIGMVDGMGLPAPEVFAWFAAFAETVGATLIALGLLTRPASLLLILHFTIVVLLGHAGDPFGRRELPLFFAATAILLLLAGPGRYSLDEVLRRRGRRP